MERTVITAAEAKASHGSDGKGLQVFFHWQLPTWHLWADAPATMAAWTAIDRRVELLSPILFFLAPCLRSLLFLCSHALQPYISTEVF
jgi:hypothetical protein